MKSSKGGGTEGVGDDENEASALRRWDLQNRLETVKDGKLNLTLRVSKKNHMIDRIYRQHLRNESSCEISCAFDVLKQIKGTQKLKHQLILDLG